MSATASHPGPFRRLLQAADRGLNRLYGWKYNPIYQSGTLVVVLFVVLLVTGLWLLFFYRIGAPWESVARLTASRWVGNWVRGLHRIASDATVVAVAVHALRMLVQRRSWGPRTLAWVSGLGLTGVVLVCGWTGFVMVWDTFGLALADEGARLFEALPLLSEPIRRTFSGERPVPSAFFFLNLFLHVALPLGMGLLLWLHVSRVARPLLWPPRALAWGAVAVLLIAAVVWPVPMFPRADPLVIPDRIGMSWFYGFWLPLTQDLRPGVVWGGVLALTAVALMIPWLTRPRQPPAPSEVNSSLCTGCTQCSLDCPYEAITMVERTDGRDGEVARVDGSRCVSCGICAGSCAPMGIGPPGRDGRSQLSRVRQFLQSPALVPGDLVVMGCVQAVGDMADEFRAMGARWLPVDCVGNLHTSTVEFCLRAGAAGVLMLTCPPRDCTHREGPRWLHARLYQGREAELKERVDRRRIQVAAVTAGDVLAAITALARFREQLAALGRPVLEPDDSLDAECETAAVGEDS